MKQKSGSNDCLAVVAAMIVKKPLKDFKSKYSPDSKKCYSDRQLCDYLIHNGWGYWIGIGISPIGYKIDSKESKINLEISIKGYPAYVAVESEVVKGGRHAIYWDGHKVWDPNPDVKDGRPLSDYKIYEWYPIQRLKEGGITELERGKVTRKRRKK